MAGYVRQDISNNIADGNIINSSDFDNEYNAIEAAFSATTGHTHDGTAAEGAPITKIGPTQDVVASASALTPKTDNTIDLGSTTLEYKDLWIDGTANIDSLVADTADINGGTIDGVTIGGASAGAGSFTTLSASSTTTLSALTASTALALNASKEVVSVTNTGTGNNVLSASPTLTGTIGAAALTLSSDLTLSGGTANGVAYLNGSKVLTTGSALVFDGTNLGIGTSSPAYRLQVTNTAASNFVSVVSVNTGTAGLLLGDTDSATVGRIEYENLNNAMTFFTNGSERARIDSSGNLVVGRTAILGGARAESSKNASANYSTTFTTGTSSAQLALTDFSATATYATPAATLVFGAGDSGTAWSTISGIRESSQNSAIAFGTASGSSNTTERMRLDSSGNLGLGVTPSGWGTYKAIQNGQSAFMSRTGGSDCYILSNNYYDGTNFRYINTAAAAYYRQDTGAHSWLTAPSGTAGNAISFTQAMTLDASGNLAVGTSTTTNAKIFSFVNDATLPGLGVRQDGAGPIQIWQSGGAIERARITSGGDFGIGTTTPGTRLHVTGSNGLFAQFLNSTNSTGEGIAIGSGTNLGRISTNGASTAMAFEINATERARITSGGDLLVGTTSGNERLRVSATNNAAGFVNTTAASATAFSWNQATSGDNIFYEFGTEASFTGRGSITYNRAGGLVAYNTTSDYRAKDILGPVINPGATIDALKVYEGQMKGATQSRPMLVAHEAQAVAPYSVTGEKDAVNDNGDPVFQQMDVSSLVPLLIAEIQSLRARVAALETN